MDSCLVFQGIIYLFLMEKVRSKHLHTTAHLNSTSEVNDARSICAERLRPMLTIRIVQDLFFWKVSWALAPEDPLEIIAHVCEQEYLAQSAISRTEALGCMILGAESVIYLYLYGVRVYMYKDAPVLSRIISNSIKTSNTYKLSQG